MTRRRLLYLTACGILSLGRVTLASDISGDVGWPGYNNGYDSTRHAPLTLINPGNAAKLGQICSLKIADAGAFQAGPLVIGDTMYVTAAHTTVALNATDCTERWRSDYTPDTAEAAIVNRGVAFMDGRLYRGTGDARLLAVDAANGTVLWKTVVGDPAKGEALTSAPIAWKGLVFIGLSGGDLGIKGRMMAFDATTGREVWTFNLIPTGQEAGAETWKDRDAAQRGGGATWSSYTLDPATGELFIPVGNPAPALSAAARPGQNLYTNAVVILDAMTGKLKWWYQLKSPDNADHDLGAAPVLYQNSDHQSVVAVAGKDGYVTAIDRASHAPLFRTAVTTIKNTDTPPTPEGVMVCPGMGGGTKWNGPSFDVARRTLFVAATDWCSLLKTDPPVYVAGKPYWGGRFSFDTSPDAAKGWITALDSDSGKIRWQYHVGALMSAGVTSTDGGVLFTGDTKGNFRVFDSRTGAVLREIPMNASLAGGMVTYAVGGKQYVAFTAGNISRSTYELAGTPTVVVMGLTNGVQAASLPAAPAQQATAQKAHRPGDPTRGKALYLQSCVSCHGDDGTALTDHRLAGRKDRLTKQEIAQRIKTPKAPMPVLFPAPYGEQDVLDIVAYVGSTAFQGQVQMRQSR